MGGTIADQFTNVFKLDASKENNLLLGISAGFASVLGLH
jgi:H+/Cl- antiporter ClcA